MVYFTHIVYKALCFYRDVPQPTPGTCWLIPIVFYNYCGIIIIFLERENYVLFEVLFRTFSLGILTSCGIA